MSANSARHNTDQKDTLPSSGREGSGRWRALIDLVLLRRSLYWRIAAAFLILTAIFGLSLVVLFVRLWSNYFDEAQQRLYWELASEMADQLQPELRPGYDPVEAQKALYRLAQLAPVVDPYVLDSRGEVVIKLEVGNMRAVDTAALDAFIKTVGLPQAPLRVLYPSISVKSPQIFSVARIKVGDSDGYLFLALKGRRQEGIMMTFGDMYTVRVSVLGIIVSTAATFALGLLAFYLITRNFNLISSTITKFEQGDLSVRATVNGEDEVARLGRAFNQMAGTIVSTIRKLERTDMLRRELLANVSHDVRRPITVVQAMLETFLSRQKELTSSEREDFLRRILKTFGNVDRLLTDLFELSRLNAAEITPALEDVNLTSLIDDIVERLRHTADEHQVSLAVECPTGLRAQTDPALLDRALSNLLENAILYTPAAGAVTVSAQEKGGEIELAICDTGVGIPEADQPYVFDRFFRARNVSETEPGSGLGLAIVKQIAETLGIMLRFESSPDKGTSFFLILR